ncbi:MAG: hypothetical protein JEZ03_00975 [Bacteroidales bacterium]|nr:hypothetical protein [Bacteroidales bacterium]
MRVSVKLNQFLNLLAFLIMVAFNYLANALPLHGVTTGQIAKEFPSKFSPAGFTFSIWGVIYSFLTIFIIYQIFLMFQEKARNNIYIQRIGLWFPISCLLNIAWLWTWHLRLIGISFVLILSLLFVLITIYKRLKICKGSYKVTNRILFYIPFSLYTSWISVASVANLFALANYYHLNVLGIRESLWVQFSLVILASVGVIVLLKRKDFPFILVYIFAYFGVLWERISVGFHDNFGIIVAATFGIWIMISASVYHFMKIRLKIPKQRLLYKK